VTGNQLPNDNEMAGRSGEGRSGKSQGEFVEETASGKGGRNTPTRLDPTPFQQGQVKDDSKDPVGGATGGSSSGCRSWIAHQGTPFTLHAFARGERPTDGGRNFRRGIRWERSRTGVRTVSFDVSASVNTARPRLTASLETIENFRCGNCSAVGTRWTYRRRSCGPRVTRPGRVDLAVVPALSSGFRPF